MSGHCSQFITSMNSNFLSCSGLSKTHLGNKMWFSSFLVPEKLTSLKFLEYAFPSLVSVSFSLASVEKKIRRLFYFTGKRRIVSVPRYFYFCFPQSCNNDSRATLRKDENPGFSHLCQLVWKDQNLTRATGMIWSEKTNHVFVTCGVDWRACTQRHFTNPFRFYIFGGKINLLML